MAYIACSGTLIYRSAVCVRPHFFWMNYLFWLSAVWVCLFVLPLSIDMRMVQRFIWVAFEMFGFKNHIQGNKNPLICIDSVQLFSVIPYSWCSSSYVLSHKWKRAMYKFTSNSICRLAFSPHRTFFPLEWEPRIQKYWMQKCIWFKIIINYNHK